jgi:hypothetical protein
MSSLSCWESAGYIGLLIVIVGVAAEGIHDFTSWFKQTWWGPHGGRAAILVLIIGLALEGVAQVKANSTSGQIIAFLGSQAAATRERAAKLEIQLAKIRANRRLEREAQARITSDLQPFAGTPFTLASNGDTDSVNLALDVRAALVAARFVERFTQSRMVLNPPNDAPRIALIVRSGVSLEMCRSVGTVILGTSAPAVLLSALNREIPGADEHAIDLSNSTECASDPDPDLIHILIGAKIM